jgi:outer membrane protein
MWGGQARYAPFGPWYLDLELLADGRRNVFGNARLGVRLENQRWRVNTFAELQPKSRGFNSLYYGLDSVSVAAGSELSLGFIADYHLWTNIHLFGAGSLTHLDRGVRNVPFIDRNWNSELWFGLGLSEDRSAVAGPLMHGGSYIRVAHGWMTPSSLEDIFNGVATKDPYNNQMTSVFYGHPLSNTLLTLPIDVFLHSGFVQHWKSEVQSTSQEFVVSVKIYYTIPLPWRIRVGAAEGLSWINQVTFVERSQLGKKGFESSQLLNFLDFSADINIGDIVRNEEVKSWALGYGIHHRSAIYELSQQFGRIRGGSNVQSVYLQKSF